MDTVNQRGLLGRPYGYEDDGGGFDRKDINGAHKAAVNGVMSSISHENGIVGGGVLPPTRTSELTIAFEGEVYVFPAVTPEKGFLQLLVEKFHSIGAVMSHISAIPLVA